MKNIIFILSILVSGLAFGQTRVTEKGTTITVMKAKNQAPPQVINGNAIFKFETKKIDFGKIQKGSKGVTSIKFINEGDVPIIIQNIRSTCGCTVPSWPKKPIKPGEEGVISVKYDTKRVGPIRKSIAIFSNAIEPRKIVRIVGEVLDGEKSKKKLK